jgi:FKBP-type peptidyl-prolyl cis-trans isomerase SlyD
MSDNIRSEKVADGKVVTLHYTLQVEGEVVDTSQGREPITFIQGQEQIVPGLEQELYGMEVGERKSVVVEPENGYGEVQSEAGIDIPREEFPDEIPMQPGIELQLRDQNGEIMNARIESIGDETVRLDFNHPLAGKDLHFDVEVVNLREATPEEIDHGHVH